MESTPKYRIAVIPCLVMAVSIGNQKTVACFKCLKSLLYHNHVMECMYVLSNNLICGMSTGPGNWEMTPQIIQPDNFDPPMHWVEMVVIPWTITSYTRKAFQTLNILTCTPTNGFD